MHLVKPLILNYSSCFPEHSKAEIDIPGLIEKLSEMILKYGGSVL